MRNRVNTNAEVHYKLNYLQIDERNITVESNKDTVKMFSVFGENKFDEEYHGLKFTRTSSIKQTNFNTVIGTELIEYNMKKQNDSSYIITLRDGAQIPYQGVKNCKQPFIISFMDRESGRIYLLDKSCYLDLKDKKFLEKLKEE